MFRFEKLRAWHIAIEYADMIYSITRDFPGHERFGLTSQLRRSAVSVSANLAEGCSRSSAADWARFIEIAYGSLLESVSELKISVAQGFLEQNKYEQVTEKAEVLAKMMSSLKARLKKR